MTLFAQWIVALLALLVGVVSAQMLFVPLTEFPHIAHYLNSLSIPLYLHVIGGPLALLLMPLQFISRLRNRWPLAHRISGWTYCVAVLAGGVGLLLMLPQFRGGLWAGTGFGLQAVLWLGCTGAALWFARARNLGLHRRWMLRSAGFTFSAVTLRLTMAPLVASGWTITETYMITAWSGWIVSLAGVEWWLRRGPAGGWRQAAG